MNAYIILFVTSFLNSEVPFLLLRIYIAGSCNPIESTHACFHFTMKMAWELQTYFPLSGFSFTGRSELVVNLYADFEKCIHVTNELIHTSQYRDGSAL